MDYEFSFWVLLVAFIIVLFSFVGIEQIAYRNGFHDGVKTYNDKIKEILSEKSDSQI